MCLFRLVIHPVGYEARLLFDDEFVGKIRDLHKEIGIVCFVIKKSDEITQEHILELMTLDFVEHISARWFDYIVWFKMENDISRDTMDMVTLFFEDEKSSKYTHGICAAYLSPAQANRFFEGITNIGHAAFTNPCGFDKIEFDDSDSDEDNKDFDIVLISNVTSESG